MTERLQLVDETLREADAVLERVRGRIAELTQLEDLLTERRHAIEATRITSG